MSWLLVVVAVLLALLLVGAVVVAAAWWWLTGRPPAELDVDPERASLVEERLAPVLEDFDAVDLRGTSATSLGPATVEECFLDSGDIHQPSAGRAWSVPTTATGEQALEATDSSRQVALSIAEQLRDRGWRGGQELGPADWSELTLSGEGYTVTARVSAYGDVVFLSAETPPHVCS